MIAGTIFIEENQSQSKYLLDPSTQKEVREALQIHAKQQRELW